MTDSGGIRNAKLAEALGRIESKMQLPHCLDDDTYTAFKFFLNKPALACQSRLFPTSIADFLGLKQWVDKCYLTQKAQGSLSI